MSNERHVFAPPSEAAVRELVLAYPLAWVTSGAGDQFNATLLPLRPADSGSGPLTLLAGHFPRTHPHAARLMQDPRASLLFIGPNAYMSPSWLRDRRHAPTWNYASVQCRVDIEFFKDARRLEADLRELVAAMERDLPEAWNIDELGPRYELLASRIIGFRAHVRETRSRFKLGQDESNEVYGDLVNGLARTGRTELVRWMSRSNPKRGRQ